MPMIGTIGSPVLVEETPPQLMREVSDLILEIDFDSSLMRKSMRSEPPVPP